MSSGRSGILKEARKITLGNRQDDYGTPENNFGFISALWEVYDYHRYTARGLEIRNTPFDVAMKWCCSKWLAPPRSPVSETTQWTGPRTLLLRANLGREWND